MARPERAERITTGPEDPPKTAAPGRSLPVAVATALVLLGLIIACYFVDVETGFPAFFVLICAVVLIALFELLDALVQTGRRPSIPFGVACGAGMLYVGYIERPAFIGVVLAVAMYGAFILALRSNRGANAISDVAWTLLGVAWVAGGGAAAVLISKLGSEETGLQLLIAFVLITALDDIGAYFAGTTFGRHKLAPSISPAKSWEGAIAGFPTAIAGGLLFAALVGPLDPIDGVALGVIAGSLAPVGDLVESLAKRQIGIKDSGRLLPGHGGFLDRLDAILFCAPAAFLYLRFAVF
jgi:phosphatidate cytidylyltransferase